jgi:hypothetical protein
LNTNLFLKYSKTYQIEKSKFQFINGKTNCNEQLVPKIQTYHQVNERKRHANEVLTDEPSCKIHF